MIECVASVLDNREITSGYRLLALKLPAPVDAKPGQFAMIKPHGLLEPLLRRALAVYRTNHIDEVSFLYHVLGRGTEAISRLRNRDLVDALVPLGNAWPIPSIPDQVDRAIVVAGGIGSASVLMLCEQLRSSGVPSILLFGAANESVARGCGLDDLKEAASSLVVTTDDGSLGERGLVTQPLERVLKDSDGSRTIVYTCGPWVMMKRVSEISVMYRATCYASLESPMACGFGVCVGCVVAVEDKGERGYHSYKRVCVDGSIFPSEQIRWDINAMPH